MTRDGSDSARVVGVGELRACLVGAFQALGLTRGEAVGLAGLLVDAELRGHPDHGIAALRILAGSYRDGKLNARPRPRVLREGESSLLIEGDRGCGPKAPNQAIDWCIAHAREGTGIAAAAVREWQLLTPGTYARRAAEQGLIGFACTNFDALVAPPGGRTAVLGTNPFAYGLPAGRHDPVVLDVASTVTAMQKVRVAAAEGDSMPSGVILDRAGQPTTDPEEFLAGGLLAPLGSPHAPHKGFGLALLVDVLSGVLTGSAFAQGVAAGMPGNFLAALDPEAFMPRREYLARIDAQLDQIREGERLAGVEELLLPGERGERRRRALERRGTLPVAAASWRVLESECGALDVPLPQSRLAAS